MQADVAQLVEQLIRNQQVVSSSLTVGSRIRMMAWPLERERSFLLGAERPNRFRVCLTNPFVVDKFPRMWKEPGFLRPLKRARYADFAVFPRLTPGANI